MRLKDRFRVQTAEGHPVTIRGITVTPQSRAFIVRLPIGGFVWNRPAAILVEQDGQTKRLPIIDSTRMLQLGLFVGLSLVLLIMVVIRYSQGKE